MNFIEYVKQLWKNGPSGGTPWSASRLNHMEEGIKANNDMISELNSNKVNTIYSIMSGSNLNDVLTSGFYRLEGGSFINEPTGIVPSYGQMIVCRGGADTVVQIVFSYMYSNKFAVRVGQGVLRSDGVETIWRKWSYYIGSAS